MATALTSVAVSPPCDEHALANIERQFRDQLTMQRLLADTQRGEPVRPDTLFLLFSSTKPLASIALWQQIERDAAALDDPVAAHWPAFTGIEKSDVILRHILSHGGGFLLTPPESTPERWGDWDAATGAIGLCPSAIGPGRSARITT